MRRDGVAEPKPVKLERAQTRRVRRGRWVILLLLGLLPGLMGGCPEFRNQLVDIANTATVSLVLSDEPSADVVESAAREAAAAVLGLLFDQLRTDTIR
jgi:hypothetical protein